MCFEGEVGGRLSYSAWHPHLWGGVSPAVTGPTALAPRSLNGSGCSWLQGRLPCRWAPRPRPRLLRPQDLPLLCAQSVEREVRDSTETRARRCHIRLRVPGLVRAGQVAPRSQEPGGGGLLGTDHPQGRSSSGPPVLGKGDAGWLLWIVCCLWHNLNILVSVPVSFHWVPIL